MTHDEMMEVIAAHKVGKEIQQRQVIQFENHPSPWATVSRPPWNFHGYEYRVKPREPREWKVWVDQTGELHGKFSQWPQGVPMVGLIVREVL